jgi:hypothetical protein
MPGFDGTGPMGNGPMTGGRRGRCIRKAGEARPGDTEQVQTETSDTESPLLGVGRGGRPRSGGRGRCAGGGRGFRKNKG